MNNHISLKLLLSALILPTMVFAGCPKEDNSQCDNTTMGSLIAIPRTHSNDGYSHLILDGKEIYKAKTSYMVMAEYDIIKKSNKYLINKGVISYTSDKPCFPEKPTSLCGINVILDMTGEKPVISNEFFSEYGDSKVTWVSWGKANSIIVIDDELRFKYSNGHVERVTNVKDAMTDNKAKE